jgi:hypothetical protein
MIRRQRRDDIKHEHHGVLDELTRIELGEDRADRWYHGSIRRMAPIHAEWIVEMFGELSAARKMELVRRLDDLKDAMHATLTTSL